MGRVLVTGATGFLGGHVMARLKAMGHDVVGTGRSPRKCGALRDAGYDMVSRDLAEPDIEGDLPGDITSVVHCAALSAPFGPLATFRQANVTATRNVVAFCRKRGVRRLVHISTPSIYFAFCDQIGMREDSALPPPVNHYARTKREAETIVFGAPEVSPVILRPRAIYGSGDTSLLPRMLAAARRGPLPRLGNGGAIDLTHVDDVVDAVAAALEANDNAAMKAYNISGGQMLPIRQIVDSACERAGIVPRWRKVPLPLALTAAGVMEQAARLLPGGGEPAVTRYAVGLFAYRQSLDLTKAEAGLGWTPKVDFDDGLARTFQDAGR